MLLANNWQWCTEHLETFLFSRRRDLMISSKLLLRHCENAIWNGEYAIVGKKWSNCQTPSRSPIGQRFKIMPSSRHRSSREDSPGGTTVGKDLDPPITVLEGAIS
ncbi:hypothetical protein M413DRAFT_448395 [Hebeloma cylindrosporum]|uniref:Uncharacterized protein n=1 Tax=Hebeloma cylindrosporum TaxID=76867 RepID=A0A0C2XIH9_HEBCY|nr:hypothetical protein M413DRAFT_448395 [Hebeloma cylindrosporum h7]